MRACRRVSGDCFARSCRQRFEPHAAQRIGAGRHDIHCRRSRRWPHRSGGGWTGARATCRASGRGSLPARSISTSVRRPMLARLKACCCMLSSGLKALEPLVHHRRRHLRPPWSAAGVPGRGEYLKLNACAWPTASTSASVSANSASVSPGKPTMKSPGDGDVGTGVADALDQAEIGGAGCGCGSSPSAPGRCPTCTGRWRKGISLGMSRCAAIRPSAMSLGWLVV